MKRAAADPAYTLLLATTSEALGCLAAEQLDDRRVHAARKALKTARAAIRLLRPRLGDVAYARENLALRDAARELSPLRDARSLLAAIGLLGRDGRRSADSRAAVRRLRAALAERLATAHTQLQQGAGRQRCVERIRDCRERTRHLAGSAAGTATLPDALARIHRKARNAFTDAERTPLPDTLHECRKQAKYLLAASAALRASGVRHLGKSCRRAERLAERLGDLRDLDALAGALSELIGHAGTATLRERIEGRREKLQRKALRGGRKLFKRSSKRFVARVAGSLPASPPLCGAALSAPSSVRPATPAIHCRAPSARRPRADAGRLPASAPGPARHHPAGTGPAAH